MIQPPVRCDNAGTRLPPGPRGVELLRCLVDFKRDPRAAVVDLRRRFGDVVFVRLGRHRLYFFHDPDAVELILVDRRECYGRSRVETELFRLVMGDGLLTLPREARARPRQLLQGVLSRQSVSGDESLAELTDALLERWRGSAERGEAVDVAEDAVWLTFMALCRALFGDELPMSYAPLRRTLKTAFDFPYIVMTRVIPLGARWPTPAALRFRRALAVLDALVFERIAARRRAGAGGITALDALLAAGADDHEARDHLMTLLFAAYSTTGTALAWVLYLLATHPAACDQIRAEVASDLSQAPFTRSVVQESMRLYPPVWLTGREVLVENEIAGYRIPVGATAVVMPYSTHRHPAIWSRPDEFDPTRFSPDEVGERSRLAYFPFGAGESYCIGAAFAQTQITRIVGRIARRYRLALAPGEKPRPGPGMTMHPLRGMRMHLERFTGERS